MTVNNKCKCVCAVQCISAYGLDIMLARVQQIKEKKVSAGCFLHELNTILHAKFLVG